MAASTAHTTDLDLVDYGASIIRRRVQYGVTLIRWAINHLANAQDVTLTAALEGLAHSKRLRRTAAALERAFEDAAIAAMYHQGVTTWAGRGYTAVLHKASERRGWRSEAIINELIDRHTARLAIRFPDVPERTIRRIATEATWSLYSLGRLEWRSTDLRKAGIDPDEFSVRVPVPASLDLRGEAAYVEGALGAARGAFAQR